MSNCNPGADARRAAPPFPIRELIARCGVAMLLTAVCAVALAQSSGGTFEIEKQVVASGGTRAVGGTYALTGTAGQNAAGSSTSPSYRLTGGFHAPVGSESLPAAIFRSGFEN